MLRIKAQPVSAYCDEVTGHVLLTLPWPRNLTLSTEPQPEQLTLDLHERHVPFSQYGIESLKLTASELSRYERLNHGYAFYSDKRVGDAAEVHAVTLDIKIAAQAFTRIRDGLLQGLKLDIEYGFDEGPALVLVEHGHGAHWDVAQDSPVVSLLGVHFSEQISIGDVSERLDRLSRQLEGLQLQRLQRRVTLLTVGMGVLAVLLGGSLISRLF